MARVLVTDGEQRAALAIVRSLGERGHAPFVCSTAGASLAGASRFSCGEARVPDPLANPRGCAAALESLCRDWRVDVLLPVAEASVLAVLDEPQRFASVRVPLPDAAAFRAICDKAALLRAAREIGVAVPAQRTVASHAEAAESDWSGLDFPIVIKPSASIREGEDGRVKLGVSYASSSGELAERLAALPAAAFPILLQQRIVGPGIGVFLLLWDGAVVANFSHRRLREKPPSGGMSVYRESIPTDPRLLDLSRALLARFDWRGVAMVEYKVDAATGTPYLMEVNGRFWGSLQLAVDSGVDFPALLVRAALDLPVSPVTRYRLGVRSRWWWGDVDQLLLRLRTSSRLLALPPDAPSRGRAVLDFLNLWRPGDRNEIFRWRDPAPLFRETLDRLGGR